MKNRSMILFAIFLCLPCFVPIQAQSSRSRIEIGMGLNLVGPNQRVVGLMYKYELDYYSTAYYEFYGRSYPKYTPFGLAVQATYSYQINVRSQVGWMLDYSDYIVVIRGRSLDIRLYSFSMVPVYRYLVDPKVEFQFGPVIQWNVGKNTRNSPQDQRYVKNSFGMLFGVNKILWKTKGSYGKFTSHLLLSIPNRMGPFDNRLRQNNLFPESRIGFGNLRIGLIFGFCKPARAT